MAKKLSEFYSMNQNKANAGKISIENLIKTNPYIPKYNPKIGKVHRNIVNRITRSLEIISAAKIFSFNNINELHKQNNILMFLAFQLKFMPINYPVLQVVNA
jgi:hypothetical protein